MFFSQHDKDHRPLNQTLIGALDFGDPQAMEEGSKNGTVVMDSAKLSWQLGGNLKEDVVRENKSVENNSSDFHHWHNYTHNDAAVVYRPGVIYGSVGLSVGLGMLD